MIDLSTQSDFWKTSLPFLWLLERVWLASTVIILREEKSYSIFAKIFT